ncbi:hypothetical protein B0H66DRAFT_536878 [Apodospora peruviana]|uniref:Uncharacterized protein n=1 Tax=Apodospora peruviana TaxID=516989 RepID=A0AAE0LZM0_9PEZI|nr:hypothetical protein B0H66DRAFT_536878 [Apodospora peruviana]
MGFFENCTLDQRFTLNKFSWTPRGRYALVYDFDQRRAIKLYMADDDNSKDEDFVFETLARHLDRGAVRSDSVWIQVSPDGNHLVDQGSQVEEDYTVIPCYWTRADFAPNLPVVRRSDLVELDRLGLQVDRASYEVTPGHVKEVAFKYNFYENNIQFFWDEINCVIGIQSRGLHPHIVPFDRLVVETVNGVEKVVGFTTDFIPGDTVDDAKTRLFKLKYLHQLIETIDYLNLELGVVHGDVLSWNLLIDTRTDNLVLFDFNSAFPLVHKPEVSDVDLAVVAMFDVITRDLGAALDDGETSPQEVDGSQLLALDDDAWEKDPEVSLDADVSEFRRVLREWVERRRRNEEDESARNPIAWPDPPDLPLVNCSGVMEPRESQMRQRMIMAGEPYMTWQRPSSRELRLRDNRGKRLLATGQFA